MTGSARPSARSPRVLVSLLRDRSAGREHVTDVELFFDLGYVFAVTQLSHYLLHHPTLIGAVQAAVLLAMVWQLWAYTTWVTNWLDPNRIPLRLLLLALLLVSLLMSAAIPSAFGSTGLLVGSTYAVTQVGRSIFAVWALRNHQTLGANFERILVWCCVSGALAVAGGLTGSPAARALLWLGAVGVDLLGGAVRFYVPVLGATSTLDWNIEGGHFAERCQSFILIALGESIVVTGATLAGLLTGPLARPHAQQAPALAAFAVAFIGTAALWWLYFDRSAADAARLIASSADPGRLGRSAYHFIHPIMVAGIISIAAADDLVLQRPEAVGMAFTSWLILGGTGLFLLGQLGFKLAIWRHVNRARLLALGLLALLGLLAPHVSALALSCCAAAVLLAVAAGDHAAHREPEPEPEPASDATAG
ncbi:MAG TPA: low temperature requirement protein A [Streptosporangiaceae bacterium]|nr:low temperature requirement protein A [Streptosporangiaceae bacterium]